MARFVKTVSTTGESTGGSAGLSAADVCKTICTLLPKYKGQVGLATDFLGLSARDCTDTCCTNESYDACNTTNYPGTPSGLQYATASAGDHQGNWYALQVCNCWTCCYDRCTCLEWSLPTHCYDAFSIRFNGIKIPRCCYFNYGFAIGTDNCYSKGQNWSSGHGCCQYYYCQKPGGGSSCTGINFPYLQYSPHNGWHYLNGFCVDACCDNYRGIWISGDYNNVSNACYSCCGHRTINLEWQFWRYNNHMSGQARDYTDRFCDNMISCMGDGTPYLCNPAQGSMTCVNEMWMIMKASFFCCSHHGWNRTYIRPSEDGQCNCNSSGRGVCWNDCCPQCGGRQFSKFILYPCCCLTPHLTSFCNADHHLNHHSSWCVMALNKCVPGFTGATPSYGDGSSVKPM